MDRAEAVIKANKDVEDFLATLEPKKYEDGWPEDCWEKEMEKHPFFMSKELEDGQELPPLLEAFQQLKYGTEDNTPDELAETYKEDGNVNFKKGKYKAAFHAYSQGIEAKPENKELKAVLYCNRAATQFHLGNYGGSLADATQAKNLKPGYIKAFLRGAKCCLQLKKFSECLSWCDDGLKLVPEDECLIELKTKAEEQKDLFDKNKKRIQLVLNAIQERGITLVDNKVKSDDPRIDTEVHLDGNQLVWPVLFAYPEYEIKDYIKNFNEDDSFMVHLEEMFNVDNPPDWDENREYRAKNLQVYFIGDNEELIPFDKRTTLKMALSHPGFKVEDGVPCFEITVKNSDFDRQYCRDKKEVIQ